MRKPGHGVVFLAAVLLAFVLVPKEAYGSFDLVWHFGCNAGGMNMNGEWDHTRWFLSDGTTPVPTGCGVQVIWDRSGDGLSEPDPVTCEPSDPDDVFVQQGGLIDLNTFDVYHDDGFPYDGIGDGACNYIHQKEGRWCGVGSLQGGYDYPYLCGGVLYVRVFDGTDCSSSAYYGQKSTIVPTDLDDGGTGFWSWYWNVGTGRVNIPLSTGTPTPTPTGWTATPTPAVTPTPLPSPTPVLKIVHQITWSLGDYSNVTEEERWYDSDGTTPLPLGCGVQLIWDTAGDGPDPLDPITCDPLDDDVFIVNNAGEEINTFDVYHDTYPCDGIGDGLLPFFSEERKIGRFLTYDTVHRGQRDLLNRESVYVRVFNGPDPDSSTHYGNSQPLTVRPEEALPGYYEWKFRVLRGTTDIPLNRPTPTATPTGWTATPTPTPTQTSTDTPRPTVPSTPTPTATPLLSVHGWTGVQSQTETSGLLLSGTAGDMFGSPGMGVTATNHHIPHVSNQFPWETRLALVNCSDVHGTVHMSAYLEDGRFLGVVDFAIEPMERLIVNTSDYWNGAQGSGWCTLDSSVHLAVMTVYINGKGGRCAVVPAPPANDLFFPHFHCDALWWTGVVVTNPNHQAVTAVLTAFDDVGTVLGTSSVLIQPKAKVSGRVDTLLGLTATKGWFTVSSQGLPIQGMAVYADRRASSPVNCAVSAVVPSDSFAFSLFRNDPNWWTGMALANPNDVSEEILLTATNSAGVSIDTVRVALPAKGRLLTTVSQLFSLGGAAEGWISVDASSRPVAGVQVIRAFAAARDGSAYAPEGLAMVEGQDASSSLIFCQSEQWPSDLWTELALTNPVLAGNSLGFQVVENPGTPSHLASRNLSPNQSWVEYVLDLLRRPN